LELSDFGGKTIPEKFVLRLDFPKTKFSEPETVEADMTLKAVGLTGRVVLHVEEVLDS